SLRRELLGGWRRLTAGVGPGLGAGAGERSNRRPAFGASAGGDDGEGERAVNGCRTLRRKRGSGTVTRPSTKASGSPLTTSCSCFRSGTRTHTHFLLLLQDQGKQPCRGPAPPLTGHPVRDKFWPP